MKQEHDHAFDFMVYFNDGGAQFCTEEDVVEFIIDDPTRFEYGQGPVWDARQALKDYFVNLCHDAR